MCVRKMAQTLILNYLRKMYKLYILNSQKILYKYVRFILPPGISYVPKLKPNLKISKKAY